MKKKTRRQIAEIALTFLHTYDRGKAILLIAELLRRENRTQEIDPIVAEMVQFMYKANKQLPITITSAHELDLSLLNKITLLLQEKLNAQSSTVTHTIDPNLKGGFIVRALDYEIDTSINHRLATLEAA